MFQPFIQSVLTAQRFRARDGAELVYRDDDLTPPGDSTPVALLHHEFPHNSNFWHPWVPLLGPHMRLVRPDIRGLGLSRVPLDLYKPNLDLFISDIISLLDHVQVEKVVWIGSATGVMLGVTMAAKHPERISALVMHDPPLRVAGEHLKSVAGQEKSSDAVWFGPENVPTIIKYGMREYARYAMRNQPQLQGLSREFYRWYEEQIAATDDHLASTLYTCMLDIDVRPLVKDIRVPTLVLEGTQGGWGPPEDHRYIEAIPNVQFVKFDGPGVGLYYSKPNECSREVLRFLRDNGILPN